MDGIERIAALFSTVKGFIDNATTFRKPPVLGEDRFSELVTSVIKANLPALLNYINTQGLSINATSDLVIEFKKISVKTEDVHCAHAAVVDSTLTSAVFDLVFRIENKISVAALAVHAGKDAKVVQAYLANSQLMLRIHMEVLNNSIKVQELNISFETGGVDPTEYFWDALMSILKKELPTAGPWLAPIVTGLDTASSVLGIGSVIGTAMKAPGPFLDYVNLHPQLNDLIKDKINEVIHQQINGVVREEINGVVHEKTPKINLKDYWKPMASYACAEDRLDLLDSPWMSQPDIQKKLLRDLHLPGTHDSGALHLVNGLAQTEHAVGGGIKYGEIGFLWRLQPDEAPLNGGWPIPDKGDDHSAIFVGKALYEHIVGQVVRGTAEAGNMHFTLQLESGNRWFDLRVYLDTDENFYMQHALRGMLFTDVLKQVRSFIDAHPGAKELVFLDLSHANFDNTAAARVSQLVKDILSPNNIIHFGNDSGPDKFDFKSLADKTVESLVGEQTKVMILKTDFWARQYPAPITNTQGFEDSEGAPLEGAPLRRFGHCITPAVGDIVPWVVDHFKSNRQTAGLLKLLASNHNGLLEEELSKNPKARSANVVSVDWLQCSSGKLPVPQIIALNSTS
jgi:hypothetical protein